MLVTLYELRNYLSCKQDNEDSNNTLSNMVELQFQKKKKKNMVELIAFG